MKKEEISIIIVLAAIAIIIFLQMIGLSPRSYLVCTPELKQRVENTVMACNWCEEFMENYNGSIDDLWKRYGVGPAICMGGGTCMACVEFYKLYHNLSDEEFPYYCWSSDEGRPC